MHAFKAYTSLVQALRACIHAQLFICKRDRQSVGYIPVI